ncbi:MAG: TRAP transporter small permease [Proteobacteria bacterium]|nr:TRAP transporter small permease [Pseudomonadota bacterium]
MALLTTTLDKLQSGMKVMGSVCLAGMALVTCLDVGSDSIFNTPVFGAEEIVSFLAVMALAFALPSAHVERSHIGVELFMRMLPRKLRIAVRLTTDLVALALFSLITWRMWEYGTTMSESGEVSMNLELPEHLIIYFLAIGFCVFVLMILKDILTFIYREEE